jgi:hypothetical protein
MRRKYPARSMGGFFAHAGCARFAAAMASPTIAAGVSGISEMRVPRAGLMTAMRSAFGLSTNLPSMKFLCM